MNITIDGLVYDLNLLSAEAKAQIESVQAADLKLNELRRDAAITMTARNSYMQALKKELEHVTAVSVAQDSVGSSTASEVQSAVESKSKPRSKSASSAA